MFETPILFIIFNRPETTEKVFEQIKKIKPKYLFIAADGSRKDKLGEEELCEKTRAIIKNIDWDCELKTLFRDVNLGCGIAPFEAITWFFDNVEQGIILEDDCLPIDSFFTFCEVMLDKYKGNDNIMQVSGSNFTLGLVPLNESYYFSKIPITWGWATWKRAWKRMDYHMHNYYEYKEKLEFNSYIWCEHWDSLVETNNDIKAWDFQWYFAIYISNGIVIYPKYNLITNIGFSVSNATHTFAKPWWYESLQTKNIRNIKHPSKIKINEVMDKQFELIYTNKMPPINQRIRLKIRKVINFFK